MKVKLVVSRNNIFNEVTQPRRLTWWCVLSIFRFISSYLLYAELLCFGVLMALKCRSGRRLTSREDILQPRSSCIDQKVPVKIQKEVLLMINNPLFGHCIILWTDTFSLNAFGHWKIVLDTYTHCQQTREKILNCKFSFWFFFLKILYFSVEIKRRPSE